MDWLTLITKETDALAWPMVAVLAIFVIRHPLAKALTRLREFRWSSKEDIQSGSTARYCASSEEVWGASVTRLIFHPFERV